MRVCVDPRCHDITCIENANKDALTLVLELRVNLVHLGQGVRQDRGSLLGALGTKSDLGALNGSDGIDSFDIRSVEDGLEGSSVDAIIGGINVDRDTVEKVVLEVFLDLQVCVLEFLGERLGKECTRVLLLARETDNVTSRNSVG